LQTAVNTQSKEISTLKKVVEELNEEIEKEKDYIKQLEEMLPNSKRKKLGLPLTEEKKKEDDPLETKDDEKNLELVTSGGSF
jgi:hypothetical protein